MRTGAGRIVVGAVGVALMTVGGVLLLTGGQIKDVALWLAGAIVLHDGIIAPLVLGAGLLLAGLHARGAVRGVLVVAGCLTVIALPVLLRPGTPSNASVLPLDYGRNWLIVMGVLAAVAVLMCAPQAAGRLRRRVRRVRRMRWARRMRWTRRRRPG